MRQGRLLRVLGHGQILDDFQLCILKNSDDQQFVSACVTVTALHQGKLSQRLPGTKMRDPHNEDKPCHYTPYVASTNSPSAK